MPVSNITEKRISARNKYLILVCVNGAASFRIAVCRSVLRGRKCCNDYTISKNIMQYGSNGNSDKRNGEKRKRDLGKCTLRLNLYPESVRIKHRLILNHSGREKFVRSSILSLEEKLHRFVEKNLFRIGVLLILLCSFFVRYHLAPITVLSGDYNISLLPWVESYRASGIVKGLSQVIGNYYVPYNLFLAVIAQLPGQPWAISPICLSSATIWSHGLYI